MAELAKSMRAAPTVLPIPFRPMAEAITGSNRVLLSTDTASRRALRAVGKQAATTGDTIHLDASPTELLTPGARITEIVAHELTHVAHPSPAPRFFDDIDETPEERRAEQIGRLMAAAPPSPAASGLGAPFARRHAARPGGRGHRNATFDHETSARPMSISNVTQNRRPSEPGTLDAAALAAQLSGEAPAVSAPAAVPSNSAAAPPADAGQPAGAPERSFEERFREELERNIDLILRRVQDRLIVDLERRGGRSWPRF